MDFTASNHDVFQYRGNFEFFRAKKEEKLQLEKKIHEKVEVKSSLKTSITSNKIELEQLQDDIKQIMKKNAVSARVGMKLATLVTEFENVDYISSSTPSPVDSVPESVRSETFLLEDDETEDEVDSVAVNCTI